MFDVKTDFIEITPRDIALLNRYFSTKTLHGVHLPCGEEAKQILQASLTDIPIRNAVASLRALREDLEKSGDGPESVMRPTPDYQYGLEQYSVALRGLASKLSSPDLNALKSALLCCQVLIGIEQVRKNYTAMGQHIIGGLKIMHEHHARPSLVAGYTLEPAHQDRLPLLDIFLIKLFTAPCKFAEAYRKSLLDGTTVSSMNCPNSDHQSSALLCNSRTIAPNMRAELTIIADRVLAFLDNVSQISSIESIPHLLSEKSTLLDLLQSWTIDLGSFQKEPTYPRPEPVAALFMRLLNRTLRIIVLGALESSPNLLAKLRVEEEQLQQLADKIDERVKDYVTCDGIRDDA